MRPTILVAIAGMLFSTTSLAQTPPSSSSSGKADQSARKDSVTRQESASIVDCRKEMANAKEAQQAGHITGKEVAEQRKMAETKLKRDAAEPSRAQKNVACE